MDAHVFTHLIPEHPVSFLPQLGRVDGALFPTLHRPRIDFCLARQQSTTHIRWVRARNIRRKPYNPLYGNWR
eukprot:1323556-Amorphochlora_amoeboformis.AAC.1